MEATWTFETLVSHRESVKTGNIAYVCLSPRRHVAFYLQRNREKFHIFQEPL
jgi:hypothetical protein